MPTPAHVDFSSNVPAATETPSAYAGDDLANLRALRDMVIAGLVPGFILNARTGGTANQPQYIAWYNAALGIGLRWNITWTGTAPTTIQEEWTNDSQATWTAVDSAQVTTFDASNNATASTNSGGWVTVFLEVWAKTLKVISDLATHQGLVGAAVHGLASMATQAANAVAILGGAIDGTNVGDTTRARGSFTRIAENENPLTPALNAAVALDWSYGGSKLTVNGAHVLSFTNIPAGLAGHVLDISNLNAATWPASVDWGISGAPNKAGRCLVVFTTNDAGTKVFASLVWSAV